MTPARLQQIVDGSQRDEPMVPQAKQSLSHPASHPLHMTTASREQLVTCTPQHHTSLLQTWWPDLLALVRQPEPATFQVCTQALIWSRNTVDSDCRPAGRRVAGQQPGAPHVGAVGDGD